MGGCKFSRKKLYITLEWPRSSRQRNWRIAGKIEEIGDAPIMAVLKGYGGWPVVVGRDWVNSGSWRLEEMLGSLRRVYNAPLIIDAWVSADDKISDVNILQVDGVTWSLLRSACYRQPCCVVMLPCRLVCATVLIMLPCRTVHAFVWHCACFRVA